MSHNSETVVDWQTGAEMWLGTALVIHARERELKQEESRLIVDTLSYVGIDLPLLFLSEAQRYHQLHSLYTKLISRFFFFFCLIEKPRALYFLLVIKCRFFLSKAVTSFLKVKLNGSYSIISTSYIWETESHFSKRIISEPMQNVHLIGNWVLFYAR